MTTFGRRFIEDSRSGYPDGFGAIEFAVRTDINEGLTRLKVGLFERQRAHIVQPDAMT